MPAFAVAVVALLAALPPAHPFKVRGLVRMPTRAWGLAVTGDAYGMRLDAATPLSRQALDRAREAAERSPEDAEVVEQFALLASRAGDHLAANVAARKVLALRRAAVAKAPDDWHAQMELGNALATIGEQAAAEAAARKAVALAPDRYESWQGLAWIVLNTDPAEGGRAMDRVAALAPADDLDVRLDRCWYRLSVAAQRANRALAESRVEKAGGIRVPGGAEELAAARAEVRAALRDADAAVLAVAARLRAADGRCGLSTRDRCLAVLYQRDVLRALGGAPAATDAEPAGPLTILAADTAAVVRQATPPTADDPVRVYVAAFIEVAATPLGKEGPTAAGRDAAAAYVRRLAELSDVPDKPTAATAAFLHAVGRLVFDRDDAAAAASFRKAVRLAPAFELAWEGYVGSLLKRDPAAGVVAAREWAAASRSPESRACLAKAHEAAGDWAAAAKAVDDGLAAYPDDVSLRLSRVACVLRRETGPDGPRRAMDLLREAHPLLAERCRGNQRAWASFYRLAALAAALQGDVLFGRQNAEAYARCGAEPADAKAVMAVFPAATPKLLPVSPGGR